ncbi:hypothetical protein AB0E59_26485 [Lentzea sp. NPDC034063]|uniref:hypothetical protein n=1 Tax=unclassified Lentzea TaxID=2643253 RepID=UPI0033F9DE82
MSQGAAGAGPWVDLEDFAVGNIGDVALAVWTDGEVVGISVVTQFDPGLASAVDADDWGLRVEDHGGEDGVADRGHAVGVGQVDSANEGATAVELNQADERVGYVEVASCVELGTVR